MKDLVPKGTGNSRLLRSSIPADITHEELVALLRAGTFPVDFAGLNADGVAVVGSAYNKANVLPDDVCDTLELPTSAEPKDAFEHAALPEYSLRIGDLIASERSLPSSFLTASGGGYSKALYPDLYNLIGTDHGFSRTVTRYKDLTNTQGYGSDQQSTGRIICNKSGVYVLIFSFISTTSNREMSAIGVLDSTKNTLFRQESSVSNIVYYDRICATFDDEYLYVFERKGSDVSVYKFNASGLIKSSKKTLSSVDMSAAVVDQHPHLLIGTDLYKVDKDGLSWTKVGTLNKSHQFGIAKAGNYYFNGGLRGTSWDSMLAYTISGATGSNSDYRVKQVSDGVLVYISSSAGAYSVYKTTDGVSFTKLCTNFSMYSHTAFADDGVHYFESNAKQETWFKQYPANISGVGTNAALSRTILYGLDVDYFPLSSTVETDDGFLIPYKISTSTQGVGVQLIPKDFLFNVPSYTCGDKYFKIKAKNTGV